MFESERLPGGDVRTTTTDPSGAQSSMRYGADGTTRMTAANGTTTDTTLGPDPRWGMRAPIPTKVVKTTPVRPLEGDRAHPRRASSPSRPTRSRSTRCTDTSRSTARGHTRLYDGATRTRHAPRATRTARSPTRFDARGRLVERRFGAGVDPETMVYDARGRLDVGRPQGDADAHLHLRRRQAVPARLAHRRDEPHGELRLRRRGARELDHDARRPQLRLRLRRQRQPHVDHDAQRQGPRVRLRRRRRGHRATRRPAPARGPAATTTTGCCPA